MMRYISDDGKVFDTEQECCEYEHKIKKDKARKEQLETECRNMKKMICDKYEELLGMISEYEEKYCASKLQIYFSLPSEFSYMLDQRGEREW